MQGCNFRLGGIAPIARAVLSFHVSMRLAVSAAWQKENYIEGDSLLPPLQKCGIIFEKVLDVM